VDGEVEGDGNPRDGRLTEELGKAEKSGSTVVVGVEESCKKKDSRQLMRDSEETKMVCALTQRLFLEEQEASVDQFKVLCEVVEVVQDNELVGPATFVRADGVKDAIPGDFRQELLNKQDQQKTADDGQVKVVDLEEKVELEGLTATHKLSTAKDDNVVNNKHGGRLLECSHGGLCRSEAKVLRLVTLDRDKGLFKDGPQLKTERTVKSGHAVADPFGGGHCRRCC
jgi:hypothetical protein